MFHGFTTSIGRSITKVEEVEAGFPEPVVPKITVLLPVLFQTVAGSSKRRKRHRHHHRERKRPKRERYDQPASEVTPSTSSVKVKVEEVEADFPEPVVPKIKVGFQAYIVVIACKKKG